MTFRQNHNQLHNWKRWIESHRQELVASSLPEDIYTNEDRWWRFIGHRGLDEESGWRIETLSSQQATILHQLIAAECDRDDAEFCLQALKKVIARRDS